MAPQRIGNTYYLNEALYINAYRDRPLTGGFGGGGIGSGGWGLNEGPRRGEGSGGYRSNLDIVPGWNTIFFDEFKATHLLINKEMEVRYKKLPEQIKRDIESAKKRYPATGTSLYLKAHAEQRGLLQFIKSKRLEYNQNLEKELSFWGSTIFYKPPIYYISRGIQLIKENKLDSAFIDFPIALQAAHERKVIDQTLEAALAQLEPVATTLEKHENLATLDYVKTINLLDKKDDIVKAEQQFHLQSLPHFLQVELKHPPLPNNQSLPTALLHYENKLRTMALARTNAITKYAKANPKITPPLTSAELEALESLINAQKTTPIGPRWLDYHQSTLNKEAARALNRTLGAISELKARAIRIEQQRATANAQEAARKKAEAERKTRELAQRKAEAERKARELAHQKAEAERKAREAKQRAEAERARMEQERSRISYRTTAAASTALPLAVPIGTGAFAIPQTAYGTLQTTMREAVASLVRTAAPAVGNVLVAVLSLAWPSTLGNSERRYLISTPLADLSPPGGPDLAALALTSGSLDLPYLLAGSEEQDELSLYVTSGGPAVPVRAATFDNQRNVYSLALDNPQRILTWTPITAPGGEQDSSTNLPLVPPGTVVYTGSSLNPVKVEQERYPCTGPAGSGTVDRYLSGRLGIATDTGGIQKPSL